MMRATSGLSGHQSRLAQDEEAPASSWAEGEHATQTGSSNQPKRTNRQWGTPSPKGA
jgi:hypothetical protein